MTGCQHPRRKHTVWWWVEDGADPGYGPMHTVYDNRRDAMAAVDSVLANPPYPNLRWIKVFRSDNESYTCFTWTNSEPMAEPRTMQQHSAPVTKRRRWWRRG